MTKIIAFSGRKQSGKSSSADFIASIIDTHKINASYAIYSFADPLKRDICMRVLGLTERQCYGSDDDKNTMTDLWWDNAQLTARQAMEIIGTKLFRTLKTNVWIDATMNKIKSDNVDIAIIPDCRFPNEVEAIKDYNGFNIRLDLDPFNSQSTSEKSLDRDVYDWSNFDLVIENSKMDIEQKNRSILHFLYHYHIISTCGFNQILQS